MLLLNVSASPCFSPREQRYVKQQHATVCTKGNMFCYLSVYFPEKESPSRIDREKCSYIKADPDIPLTIYVIGVYRFSKLRHFEWSAIRNVWLCKSSIVLKKSQAFVAPKTLIKASLLSDCKPLTRFWFCVHSDQTSFAIYCDIFSQSVYE